MSHRIRLAVLVFVLSSGLTQAQSVAIGLKGSTAGAGLDLTLGLTKGLNVRAGANAFSLSQTRSEFDTTYDAELRLRSASLLLDLHPGGRGFRLSVGGVYNQNEVEGDSNDKTTVTINGTTYPVALVGTISAKATTNELCPYVGLGWGNAVGKGNRVRFTFDIGAYYHGSPKVSVTSHVNPAVPPNLIPQKFYDDLEAERRRVENDVSGYKFFPVVSLGLTVRL